MTSQKSHRGGPDLYSTESELVKTSQRALSDGDIKDPIHKLRLLCFSRGATGIMKLGRVLRKNHEEKKPINLDDFTSALRKIGLDSTNEEVKEMFDSFDDKKSGSLEYTELFNKLRPPMPQIRMKIIDQAFNKMDKSGHGVITYENLKDAYSVKGNPKYLSGDMTKTEIVKDFLKAFTTGTGGTDGADATDGTDESITREEFLNYYASISATTDNDGFFDLLLRKTYSL